MAGHGARHPVEGIPFIRGLLTVPHAFDEFSAVVVAIADPGISLSRLSSNFGQEPRRGSHTASSYSLRFSPDPLRSLPDSRHILRPTHRFCTSRQSTVAGELPMSLHPHSVMHPSTATGNPLMINVLWAVMILLTP